MSSGAGLFTSRRRPDCLDRVGMDVDAAACAGLELRTPRVMTRPWLSCINYLPRMVSDDSFWTVQQFSRRSGVKTPADINAVMAAPRQFSTPLDLRIPMMSLGYPRSPFRHDIAQLRASFLVVVSGGSELWVSVLLLVHQKLAFSVNTVNLKDIFASSNPSR